LNELFYSGQEKRRGCRKEGGHISSMYIGAGAYDLYKTFEFAEAEHRTNLTRIIAAFEAHCAGEVIVVHVF